MNQHLCRQTLARGSKSFYLASRLLPRGLRDDAAAVYAWCRRADDAVDLAPSEHQRAAVVRLAGELRSIYARAPQDDPVLAAFAEVVARRRIPVEYPQQLLRGMAMDAAGIRYSTVEELLIYCHRVAGTVGLMMCHVMGVRRSGALRRAAHLGIAMQLTNICRDVAEDVARGREYLPVDLIWRRGRSGAMRALLGLADRYYRSADRGLAALTWRCAVAVRTARNVYAAIGRKLTRRGCDPDAGRAVVSLPSKVWLLLRALVRSIADVRRGVVAPPERLLEVDDAVLLD